MATKDDKTKKNTINISIDKRHLLAGVLVAVAFFASYAYAASTSSTSSVSAGATGDVAGIGQAAVPGSAGGAGGGCCGSGGGGSAGGGGCCGGGGSGQTVKGKAKLAGGVQKIDVDTSAGYSPNEVTLKAGVPTEINFSPASGCLGTVIFPDAGVQADLSQGATVKLPAMKAGTYQWYCGMQMVFGKIIVK